MQAFSIATRHLGREDLGQADVVIAPKIGALTDMNLGNNPARAGRAQVITERGRQRCRT